MHNQTFNSESKSLYAKHLKILALDEGRLAKLDATAEEAQMLTLELPELNLPQRLSPSPKYVVWGAVSAVAAAVLFLLWPSKPAEDLDGYTFKGANKISVYYKQGNEVVRLGAGEKLAADTQIRVALTAAEIGKAYLFFYSDRNEPLASIDDARKKGVAVHPGEKVSFAGSFRLTGESVGEKIVVSVCNEEAARRFDELSADKLETALKATLGDGKTTVSAIGCKLVVQKLR